MQESEISAEDGTTDVLFAPWAPKTVLYASPCHRGEVLLFDSGQPAVLRTLPAGDSITSFAASPDGLHVAAGTAAGTVCVLGAEGSRQMQLKGHRGPPSAVAFASDSKTLLSAAGPVLMLWDKDVVLKSVQ